MRTASVRLLGAALMACSSFALGQGQDPRQIVQQAVQNELAKDSADHSRWLYFEVDQKAEHPVKQWVAETKNGDLRRVLQIDGKALSLSEQRQRLDDFIRDPSAQAKQRKGGQSDDKQAEEMLRMLPGAFIWTVAGTRGSNIALSFRPDPKFSPPDFQSKVFAAMEGEMLVDAKQHRIASLKGHLIQNVKILGGLLGQLNAGGSFDVERRETGAGVWQITETHVHIDGHALIFHTISEQEDDVKTNFRQLPTDITLEQARNDLLAAQPGETRASATDPGGQTSSISAHAVQSKRPEN